MVDAAAINQVLSIRNAAWSGVAILVVLSFHIWRRVPEIMAQWIARRQAVAAEKAADWDRLRDEVGRLAARVEALEQKLDASERREDEWRERAIAAEAEVARRTAVDLGMGQARQRAQAAMSADRLEQRGEMKKP